MATNRKVIYNGMNFQATKIYSDAKEDREHPSKRNAKIFGIIQVKLKPLLNSRLIKSLHDIWWKTRPSNIILRGIEVSFLPLAELKKWLSKNGLRILTSCDIYKEKFTERLLHCFQHDELEMICREFSRELLQWNAKIKNFQLTLKIYNQDVKEATKQEIEDITSTIDIATPLAMLTKMLNSQMLRHLWSIRFIHTDWKRPVKQRLNSICVKPNRHLARPDLKCLCK